MPLTCSSQRLELRRPVTAVFGSSAAFSSPIAMSAAIAASIRSLRPPRAACRRLPRSPCMTTVMCKRSSSFASCIAQRRERDDDAALHIGRAGSLRDVRVDTLELLKRARRLEHGVEMADQQARGPRPAAFRDQVPRTTERLAIDPARRKAERLLKCGSNTSPTARTPAKFIAAVDVDDLFQQADGLVLLALYTVTSARSVLDGCGECRRKERAQKQRGETSMANEHGGLAFGPEEGHDT